MENWAEREKEGLEEVNKIRYKSCALTTSSGFVLTRNYGPMIDSHECVIRINTQLRLGFEPHVGAKTCLRYMNRFAVKKWESYIGQDDPPDVRLFADVPRDFIENVPSNIYVVPEAFRDFVLNNFSHLGILGITVDKQASTGFRAIIFALSICDRLSLFGFESKCRPGQLYHYYDEKSEFRTNCAALDAMNKGVYTKHNMVAEHEIYREMHNDTRYPVTLFS